MANKNVDDLYFDEITCPKCNKSKCSYCDNSGKTDIISATIFTTKFFPNQHEFWTYLNYNYPQYFSDANLF